jgi:3-isopropylmalate/(R)-2-methylmalate dehydratase large subunit
MGQTIVEKIIGSHTNDEVAPGKIVWMDVDIRTARDFGGANVVLNLEREYPGQSVDDPAKTFFTFDCVAPAKTIPYASNQQICREFAKKQGIKVYDVDSGIGSHVDIEEGLALPGRTLVGTDSHLNLLGCIGCFGLGMGDQDIAFAFRTGKIWLEVPETMKVVVKGTYEWPTSAKDLTLHIVGTLGSKGALGRAVEFYGDVIENLDLAGRITLASMATEMGAVVAFIPPGGEVLEYCKGRSGADVEGVYADSDAAYVETVEIDVSDLAPRIASPPNPSSVTGLSVVEGLEVGSVFIGSCTNGRFEDFEAAFEIIQDRGVKPGVMAKVVPATKEVYGKLLTSGLLQKFFDAGFIVGNAGCAGCASGQIGMTGEGEVQLSTGNRNFPGKQGKGDTYLVSPQTAALAAVEGKVTIPEA